ncbi:MAG: helix-turn-helix domain-containing protein [Acidobacteriia bacterium]|nr:helix-turn-helix domain-containing protein [Terriglobia bacterium]
MVTLNNHIHYIGKHNTGSMADDPDVAGKVPKKLKRKYDTPERAFGAVITELRLKQGLSSATVAHQVGCNPGYMSEMEHGKRNPTFKVLKAIADVHKIKLSVIMARAERKHENCKKKKS